MKVNNLNKNYIQEIKKEIGCVMTVIRVIMQIIKYVSFVKQIADCGDFINNSEIFIPHMSKGFANKLLSLKKKYASASLELNIYQNEVKLIKSLVDCSAMLEKVDTLTTTLSLADIQTFVILNKCGYTL